MSSITQERLTHTDGCVGVKLDDACAPVRGAWNQPSGWLVQDAEEQLKAEFGEEPPWCRVHERAWKIRQNELELT